MLRFLIPLLLLGSASMPARAASVQCGQASHYGVGDGYHGQRTASGQRFNAYGMTAAHPSLPMGSNPRFSAPSRSLAATTPAGMGLASTPYISLPSGPG